MKTTLIFVRHGESLANLQNLFAGHYDIPLTDLGHLQAERTAQYLDRYTFDHIYASDLKRAYQTAEHTAARQGKEIVADKRFREIFAGKWEEMSFKDLPVRYTDSYHIWRTEMPYACPDDGESVKELSVRIWDAVKDILAKHRGQTVAVFTHATPVRTLAWRWNGYDIFSKDIDAASLTQKVLFCPNASVSMAEYDEEDRLISFEYGYNAHLSDLTTELPKNLV